MTHFKNAVCAVLALGMLALTACGDVNNGGTNEVKSGDPVVEAHLIESGGIDGRSIDRAVYKEGDSYVFAYTERRSQPPEIFGISEEEYNEIMSLDYENAVAKYEATSHAVIYDDIYYSVRVVYANGEELSGEVDRGKLTKKFAHLYKKYIGDV